MQIAQSITDVVTRSKPSNQSRRCVLCMLQRSDGGLRKNSKYRIAVIKSTQHECRNTTGRNVRSKQPADLLQTVNMIKTSTGDFIDMTL